MTHTHPTVFLAVGTKRFTLMSAVEEMQKKAESLLNEAADIISKFEDPDEEGSLLERNGELLSHSEAVFYIAGIIKHKREDADAEKESTDSKHQCVRDVKSD